MKRKKIKTKTEEILGHELIEEISAILDKVDGKLIAEFANRILSERVKFKEENACGELVFEVEREIY